MAIHLDLSSLKALSGRGVVGKPGRKTKTDNKESWKKWMKLPLK